MIRKCLYCGREFKTIPARIKIGKGKYCSRKCYWSAKKGKWTSPNRYSFKKRHTVFKETREKIGLANKTREWKQKSKDKIRDARLGKKVSKKTRLKMSKSQKGEKGNNWRGGINPINDTIRKNIEYRLWREVIYARDNWTCQKCRDNKGGNLNSHHIQNFAEYPELRFAIDNGITLCKKCHKEFHKKYGYKNNTKKQLEEFLI